MQSELHPFAIGGVPVTDLVETHGTPLYVYDGQKIVSQLQTLQRAFSGVTLRLKYAAKALTNLSVLKLLRGAGADLDVVSIEEAQLGLLAGYRPGQILYTPSGVSFDEIVQAVEMGLEINIDSLSMLEKLGRKYGCVGALLPAPQPAHRGRRQRQNPGRAHPVQVRHLHRLHRRHSPAGEPVPDQHQRPAHPHRFRHQRPGRVHAKRQHPLRSRHALPQLRFISFGGGFKVAYQPGEYGADVEALARELVPGFRAFCDRYGRDLEMWFEPGKFIVSEAGYLLVRANVVKQTPAVTFVGVDSGFNHLVRPMFYDAYHEIVNVSNPDGPRRRYNVVGYICETDTFAQDRELPEVREGDLLVFRNAGAYGFSMASNYNSRPRPAEVLVYNGKAHLVRQRETLQDLTRNQVVVDFENGY
jgi:diaminopimelate decarboxylase